jgi:hypothetical protein
MKANLQSPSSGHIIDDITLLRQRLEYFERHIQNKSQEVKNDYAQALSVTLEAEKSIRHLAETFNTSVSK